MSDGEESVREGAGGRSVPPGEGEAADGGGADETTEDDLGGQVLRFGGAHERGTEAGAHEADRVGARPDFLGDVGNYARLGECGEGAVVEAGVVDAREKHERDVGEVTEFKHAAAGERVIGGQDNAVGFLEKEAGLKTVGQGVGMEEAAGDVVLAQGGDLAGGGRLVELDADAGMRALKLAQDRGQHGRHGEVGEAHARDAVLTGGDGGELGGETVELAQPRLDAGEEGGARDGELDATLGADKKGEVERGLELGDLAAEGELRDAQGLGVTAEMEVLRNLGK